MASSMSISTVFQGRDRMSPVFNKMGRSASGFGNILKGVLGSSLIMRGIDMIGNGIRAAADEFVQFDSAITQAGAKFKDIEQGSDAAIAAVEQLGTVARDIGATTEFSATQAAEGLDFLAMAGFTTTQAIASLPGVVDLATAANVDLSRATDIASDSLGAFNLMTEDSAQLQTNLNRVNDVMARTMTTANTSMEDLFESIKKGAPAFTSAGQSIESFSALAGTMANAGLKGSESGTQLRNIMLRLASPTKEAGDLMSNLGIQVKDQEGNFLDVIDILGQFENATESMGTAQRSAALSTVFGARSVTGINILLDQGADKLNDYRDTLLNAGGAASEMANTIRGSMENQIATLQSTLIDKGLTIFKHFEDGMAGTIGFITDVIRSIDLQPILDGISGFVDFATKAFGGIIEPMQKVWGSISRIGEILGGIVSRIFGNFTKSVGGAENSLDFLSIALESVSWILNRVADVIEFLSPIVEFLANLIINTVIVAFNWLKNTAETVAGALVTAWNAVGDFFSWLWDGIVAGATWLWDTLGAGFNAAAQGIQLAWNGITGFFSGIWDGIVAGATWVWDRLGDGFNAAAGAIQTGWGATTDFFGNVWDVILFGAKAAWEGIGSGFRWLGDLLVQVGSAIGGFFESIWQGIADAFYSIVGPVVEVAKGVGDFFGGIIGGIADFFTGGGGEDEAEQRTEPLNNVEAPNQAEVESRGSMFEAIVNVNNAPEGTTVETKMTEAPGIRRNMMGAN